MGRSHTRDTTGTKSRTAQAWIGAVAVYAVGFFGFLAAYAASWIKTSDLVTGVSVMVGALPALFLALVQLRETQRENDRMRAIEVRRSLEVEAFRTVASTVVKLTKGLAEFSMGYASNAVILRGYELPADRTIEELATKWPANMIGMYQMNSELAFAVESHEIALYRFHHLRIFIQHRLQDLAMMIAGFGRTVITVAPAERSSREQRVRIAEACEKIAATSQAIQSYLLDYRIEVMNGLVGDVFHREVPRRQPLGHNVRTLVDIATPAAVAKESERRNFDAIAELIGMSDRQSEDSTRIAFDS